MVLLHNPHQTRNIFTNDSYLWCAVDQGSLSKAVSALCGLSAISLKYSELGVGQLLAI